MKRRPKIAEAVVVAILTAGAGVAVWAGIIRTQRDGQQDSAIALFAAALFALAFVPVFLSLGKTHGDDGGSDDEAEENLGGRGRLISYLGTAIGLGIGYALLREHFSAVASSLVALGSLVIRGTYKILLARAEGRGSADTP